MPFDIDDLAFRESVDDGMLRYKWRGTNPNLADNESINASSNASLYVAVRRPSSITRNSRSIKGCHWP